MLDMTAPRRRPLEKPPVRAPKSLRKAIPGRDGKTLGQRVSEAMAYEAGRRGAPYRQTDLVGDVCRLMGLPERDQKTQQAISAITTHKVTRSHLTTPIAAACHVNPVWLASGVGPMIV